MFFFFSSRRRHTRFDCDWSSDVCSSDLDGLSKIGLSLLPPESDRLYSLSTVKIPDGVDDAAVRKMLLEEYSIEIGGERKSTRLNSRHSQISHADLCLKTKRHFAQQPLEQ